MVWCGQEPLEIQALPPQVEPQPPSEAILAPTVPPDSMTLMSRSNGSCAVEAEAVLMPWPVILGVTGILLIGPVEHFESVCCVRPTPVGGSCVACAGLLFRHENCCPEEELGTGHGSPKGEPRYAVRLPRAALEVGSSRPGPAPG